MDLTKRQLEELKAQEWWDSVPKDDPLLVEYSDNIPSMFRDDGSICEAKPDMWVDPPLLGKVRKTTKQSDLETELLTYRAFGKGKSLWDFTTYLDKKGNPKIRNEKTNPEEVRRNLKQEILDYKPIKGRKPWIKPKSDKQLKALRKIATKHQKSPWQWHNDWEVQFLESNDLWDKGRDGAKREEILFEATPVGTFMEIRRLMKEDSHFIATEAEKNFLRNLRLWDEERNTPYHEFIVNDFDVESELDWEIVTDSRSEEEFIKDSESFRSMDDEALNLEDARGNEKDWKRDKVEEERDKPVYQPKTRISPVEHDQKCIEIFKEGVAEIVESIEEGDSIIAIEGLKADFLSEFWDITEEKTGKRARAGVLKHISIDAKTGKRETVSLYPTLFKDVNEKIVVRALEGLDDIKKKVVKEFKEKIGGNSLKAELYNYDGPFEEKSRIAQERLSRVMYAGWMKEYADMGKVIRRNKGVIPQDHAWMMALVINILGSSDKRSSK